MAPRHEQRTAQPQPAGQRAGGVWDYISPSRLGTWLACPLKFKRRYLDGIRTPTSPAAFLGKVVHGDWNTTIDIGNWGSRWHTRTWLADWSSIGPKRRPTFLIEQLFRKT